MDSADAALDRVKMMIYKQFAEYGLPCPISGHSSSMPVGEAAAKAAAGAAGAAGAAAAAAAAP